MTGKELMAIRKRLGLTQAELAERLGVARFSISRQERGAHGIRESLAKLIRFVAEIEGRKKPRGSPRKVRGSQGKRPGHGVRS